MSFTDALQNFARDVTRNFALPVPANPEDQLKSPMQKLLREGGTALRFRVDSRTETPVPDVGARPDLGVTVSGLLCGHIELKAPGKGARPERLTGGDRRQWKKFKSLPNLIYCDGNEWGLYRDGKRQDTLVRASGDVTADGVSTFADPEIEALERLLRDFLSWEPITPRNPRALALMLAPLCRLLREDVLEAVQRTGSAIEQLASDWRRTLFPDADDRQFADAYAQTLTYALLLAKLSGANIRTTDAAATALDPNHGLLAQTLRVLSDPNARAEIATGVDLIERIIDAVDPAELAPHSPDLWLYFYEDFLAAYDPTLRRKEGVYFTPVQVVEAQVRLAAELLKTKFDKPLGFADDDVTFLDPAAGTGTYPLAVIKQALKMVEDRFGPGAIPARATIIAQNLHAFEYMVGPYAVAHLRISQQILAAGGTLPPAGPGVYLTDTLESPYTPPPPTLTLFHRKLSDEHERAQTVKTETQIIVCMGNPPYHRDQFDPDDPATGRRGGWVRHGDDYSDPPLRHFIDSAITAGQGLHVKNLYNSYVYFWRWALWKLFETTDEPAIVSFITASSYLRGPGFVGMRQVMRETFDELWIIDLEGDNRGARRTENVFDIETPVAIGIGVRYEEPQATTEATVHYTKITGTRAEKLATLASIASFADLAWETCFTGWQASFLPDRGTRFYEWPDITDIFPWQHSGTQLKRTWPIAETRDVLYARWNALLEVTGAERARAFHETDRKINQRHRSVDGSTSLAPLASLNPGDPPIPPVRYGFRSLDRQWVFPDGRLADRPRPPLWRVASERQVFLTSLLTEVLGKGPAAMVSAYVPDLHHFSGRGAKDVIPLWRDADRSSPNMTNGILDMLGRVLSRSVTAEDVFAYCYGILQSPDYVKTFWDDLSIPGLHIPVTTDPTLFATSVEFGRYLIWLHTFGERFVPDGYNLGDIPTGSARNIRPVPTSTDDYPETYSYDEANLTLNVGQGEFAPVSEEVWNFSVSGFSVLQSWLSYRMKSGAGRRSSPLDNIRPTNWIAELNEELLKLLWILEATVALQPELNRNLAAVLASPLLLAEDLPKPTDPERLSPTLAGPLI